MTMLGYLLSLLLLLFSPLLQADGQIVITEPGTKAEKTPRVVRAGNRGEEPRRYFRGLRSKSSVFRGGGDPLEDTRYFQGDILASFEQLREDFGDETAEEARKRGWTLEERRLGIIRSGSRLWPVEDGVIQVPYEIAPASFNKDETASVEGALSHLSYLASGRVRFFPRTSQDDYVVVRSDFGGCFSAVGRVGGPQDLNLQTDGCLTRGIIQHEFLHALGYYHEQSRPDRDAYIDLNYDAIALGYEHNFAKQSTISSRGRPYDYNSLLHYSPRSFAQTRVSCSGVASLCNRQLEIRYAGADQGQNSMVCLSWVSGIAKYVRAENCLTAGVDYKTWLVERYNDQSVTIRPVSDSNLCLTVQEDGSEGYYGGATFELETCDARHSTLSKAQRFQLFSRFDSTSVRIFGDNEICLEQVNGEVVAELCDDRSAEGGHGYQTWFFDFDVLTSTPCQNIVFQCEYLNDRYNTIDAHGNNIGQRSRPSTEDIIQLGLLYDIDVPPPPVPIAEQPWFWPTISSISSMVLLASAVIIFLRFRRSSHEATIIPIKQES